MPGPFKLAIVGGGPSAFYVASRILSLIPLTHREGRSLSIDIYDRLWSPHGLVRYGVAPDHPEVKNCIHKFDTTAQDPRLSFYGNVNILSSPLSHNASPSPTESVKHAARPIPHALQIPLSSFYSHYSHILFASGCTTPIYHPLLPMSSSCIPALDIVHWYTNHPSNPPAPPLRNTTHLTLIGHGNVSLDVARILLSSPDSLGKFDVPDSVLQVLSESRLRHISIVGRRGPLQASFTAKELREMMNLPGVAFSPLAPDLLENPPPNSSTLTAPNRQQSRLLSILKNGSKEGINSTSRSWDIQFFRSPTKFLPRSADAQAELHLSVTTLDAQNRAVPTSTTETLQTDLVVTSLGYRSESTTPFYDSRMGHVSNEGGQVYERDQKGELRPVKNMYASGWAANGAKGVLNWTMLDAYSLAGGMLVDHFGMDLEDETSFSLPVTQVGGRRASKEEKTKSIKYLNASPLLGVPPIVVEGLKDGMVTTYSDWRLIDAEEIRRGAKVGKERERMDWANARQFLSRSG